MTKDETLDWLYRLRSNIGVYMPREWCMPMINALDTAIEIIEQHRIIDVVPSVEEMNRLRNIPLTVELVGGWIPCSERLPEDNEEVLVTYGDKVIISRYMGVGYGFMCGLVDAWMPLPQPWKGDKE